MVINKTTITRCFKFEACHHLPNYKGKCANVHGHSYFGEVTVSGPIDKETGMIMDFHTLAFCIDEMIEDLDHQDLNKVTKENFPNDLPTAERMVTWMLEYLQKRIHSSNNKLIVECVTLNETKDNYATAFYVDAGINVPEGHYYYSEVPVDETETINKNDSFTFNKDNFEKSLKDVKNKLEKNLNEFVENIKNIEINISKRK